MGERGYGDGKTGDIVELGAFRSQAAESVLQRVQGYWELQRKGRIVPSRSDIEPRGLGGLLGHVFIAERISTGLARFRIAGSHMNELIGLDVRGMPISAIFAGSDRDDLSQGMEAVFDHPAVLRLAVESPSGFGRKLPLRSDLGEVSRALGVVVMEGEIGRTPRRLEIKRQSLRGLTGYGGPEAAEHRVYSEARATPPQQPPRPRTTLSQHLRLVADNTVSED